MKKVLLVIFYLISKAGIAQLTDFPGVDFRAADSVAELFPRHSLKDPHKFAQKLTAPFNTDVEKFRVIFKWIANNIDYDVRLYRKEMKKRLKYRFRPKRLKRWDRRYQRRVVRGALQKYKTVCSGYAHVLEEMSMGAGLSSVSISGIGRTAISNEYGSRRVNHAWNAVRLDGKWYLADVTWASGSVVAGSRRYIRDFNPNYFLTDPNLFVHNHLPKDSSWTLLLQKPTLTEFMNRPLFYSGALTMKVNNFDPEKYRVFTKVGKPTTFRFTINSAEELSAVKLTMENKKEYDVVRLDVRKDQMDWYYVEHTFQKKGMFYVDLHLNHKRSLGYVVWVK